MIKSVMKRSRKGHMFLFPLNKYLSIGLLGHVMSVNLTLCKSTEQFYKMSVTPTNSVSEL